MQISSNIAGVLAQLGRFRQAVPIAAAHALDPGRWPWREQARATAANTLRALAESPAQAATIPSFVNSVQAAFLGGALSLSIGPIAGSITPLDRLAAQLAEGQPVSRAELQAAVTEWVEAPPDLDHPELGGKIEKDIEREGRRPPNADEDAAFIAWLMTAPEDRLLGRRADLRDRFTRHVLTWLQRGHRELSEAVIDRWLHAVLTAWREIVPDHFHGAFKIELNRQRGAIRNA
jgi:hypothetical protein